LVVLDTEDLTRVQVVEDMPVVKKRVGKTDRARLDFSGLDEILARLNVPEPIDLVVIEDPGARPAQAGAMAFGFSLGALHKTFHSLRWRVETIVPTKWKPALRAPKDKEQATQRAEELFPQSRELFRGPKGGKLDGRAEAAMLALYGAKHFL
jgi:hypothetical protein